MVSDIQKLKIARELRLSGKSLSEIMRETGVSRSTLSIWLRDIVLTEKQLIDLKQRVNTRITRGRLNASIILKSNRVFVEKKIYDGALRDFPRLAKNPFFILGLSLYWSKGIKKGTCMQFSSSNKIMLNLMIKWLVKFLSIDESIIKKREYTSHSRLDIPGIDRLRLVIAWQKLLIAYYNDVP